MSFGVCVETKEVFLLFTRVAYVMATMPHFISYFCAGHHTPLSLFIFQMYVSLCHPHPPHPVQKP